jgi:uncharacterized YigZ family protein
MKFDGRRIVPAAEASQEIRVVNSRFIGYAARAETIAEAREFLERIRQTHPDANHHVPAFLIGHSKSVIEHSSDAGEPSGTAGRPALTVLKGSGIGDIAVVVVRYFGGTKLGTGGLVRAYTDAVKAVIRELPLAEKVETHLLRLACDYSLYERMAGLVEKSGGEIIAQDFAELVNLEIRLRSETVAGFTASVRELSRGRVGVEILRVQANSLIPLRVEII